MSRMEDRALSYVAIGVVLGLVGLVLKALGVW